MKKMFCTILLDCIVLAALGSVLIPRFDKVRSCDENLYYSGAAICIYNGFFIVRNLVICFASTKTSAPLMASYAGRGCMIILDCIIYTGVVVWVSISINSKEAVECRDADSDIDQFWWAIMVLMIIGYIQMFVEWIVCVTLACVGCVFCCFYMQAHREAR